MRQIASTAFLSISWLTALAYFPSFSQSAEPDIWGEAIMKQPFDSGVFREIRIPAWVQGTTGCGYTLSVMDLNARAKAAAHGVTVSELGFVDPFYAYYDSRPLREEVVPIHDIRIIFSPTYRLRRVHLEPEGRELKVEIKSGGPSVVVPRLDVHSMVVAELDQPPKP
jgi:hypothetical protein